MVLEARHTHRHRVRHVVERHLTPGTKAWLLRRALEPYLAPEGIDTARAESTTLAVSSLTDHVFEHDRFVVEMQHPACLLVDHLLHSPQDAKRPAAIRNCVATEVHAAILRIAVQGAEDLAVRVH